MTWLQANNGRRNVSRNVILDENDDPKRGAHANVKRLISVSLSLYLFVCLNNNWRRRLFCQLLIGNQQ